MSDEFAAAHAFHGASSVLASPTTTTHAPRSRRDVTDGGGPWIVVSAPHILHLGAFGVSESSFDGVSGRAAYFGAVRMRVARKTAPVTPLTSDWGLGASVVVGVSSAGRVVAAGVVAAGAVGGSTVVGGTAGGEAGGGLGGVLTAVATAGAELDRLNPGSSGPSAPVGRVPLDDHTIPRRRSTDTTAISATVRDLGVILCASYFGGNL